MLRYLHCLIPLNITFRVNSIYCLFLIDILCGLCFQADGYGNNQKHVDVVFFRDYYLKFSINKDDSCLSCFFHSWAFFQYELDARGFTNSRFYSVFFVFIGAFIFTNLFIGIILQVFLHKI